MLARPVRACHVRIRPLKQVYPGFACAGGLRYQGGARGTCSIRGPATLSTLRTDHESELYGRRREGIGL
jgi:hypothetical protein